jgi:hypothetical protein
MLPKIERVVLATLVVATILVLSTALGIVAPWPAADGASVIW